MNITVTTPASQADRDDLYRFFYGIWARELGQDLPGTDHTRQQIHDELDDWALHIMAIDESGRIAACVRCNHLGRGRVPDDIAVPMKFDTLSELFEPDKVVFISHLAVSPAYRGGTVISLLLGELFRHLFETETAVAVCYCQLNLVSLYFRIGMRPYLPNFEMNNRLRVPLIGCINDRAYLKETGSPLHMLLPSHCDDGGEAALLLRESFPAFDAPGVQKINVRSLWAQLAHAAPAANTQPVSKLFQDLDRKVLEGLLKKLPQVHLGRHETLPLHKTGEAGMGILLSGCLGVGVGKESNLHFIYVIRPGEPFGALATLAQIRPATLLQSLEESEALLLPENLFEKLAQKDPPTALHLYKNLLGILARRMAAVNAVLAGEFNRPEGIRARVRRPALHASNALKSHIQRPESYHFDTLSDKAGELDRLIRQARAAEALELSTLKRMGLRNGDKVLDLGSGPGITSLMLARHFPDATVIGVEPDWELRNQAEAEAQKQTLNNCRFLEGTAQDIPLPNRSMDFSYARLLFQHIPDPLDILAEMKRVTRPGGIACVLDVDDGTIFIHPAAPEWEAVEERVVQAQAMFGGDRHVGRKLLGYMLDTGFSDIRLDIVPITTQMLGPDTFFEIVFGFKQQHLKRADDWDEDTARVFARIRESLKQPGAFASENLFVAHATSP